MGLVYLTPVAGGWIADRILGLRRTVLYGGIILAVGHSLTAIGLEGTFLAGLVAIALGTGRLKPRVPGMVGQLNGEGDTTRDAGFSISTWASTSAPSSRRAGDRGVLVPDPHRAHPGLPGDGTGGGPVASDHGVLGADLG